jgi:uncharacterized Zn finger protein (UPF0148 family)
MVTTMLGWEQIYAGKLLHAYDGHAVFPVCGDRESKRSADDKFPRTTYVGPMPPPTELICPTCQTWERDHDPVFLAGREYERKLIREALSKEANRIFNKQEKDYPSNVLDAVSLNLLSGYDSLSLRSV